MQRCTDYVLQFISFWPGLGNGINDALYDWWLNDYDFHLDVQEFKQWREVVEEGIISDQIEFWETWYEVDRNGNVIELSAEEKDQRDEARSQLLARHEQKRAAVEREAVRIGL